MQRDMPGTTIFDGTEAQRLGAQPHVLLVQQRGNRAAFLADEGAYCKEFGLNDLQRAAVKSRSVLKMIKAGGNAYYLAKLAGIFGPARSVA